MKVCQPVDLFFRVRISLPYSALLLYTHACARVHVCTFIYFYKNLVKIPFKRLTYNRLFFIINIVEKFILTKLSVYY